MTSSGSVLPPLRTGHAADVLLEVRTAMSAAGVRPTDPDAPHIYAGRILGEDDGYGRELGLVVQGDEVGWRQLDALFDLAMLGALLHRETAHPGEFARNDCVWCDRAEAYWHAGLVDVITARRGTTATDIDEPVRSAVRSWLAGRS
jgi:hypothetical protein